MRNMTVLAAVSAMIMGLCLPMATTAISRPGQIMTTRDMNIEFRGSGWVGRSARDCCSGRS